MTDKKIIAVIAGGNSSEDVISYKSGQQVYDCLDRSLFEPYLVKMKGRDWHVALPDGQTPRVDLNDFSFTHAGRKIQLEYALIMIHGTPGENGLLQGYLEMMGIPYSTCGVETSVLTFDKSLCKRLLSGKPGIHLAREIVVRRGDPLPDPGEVAAELGLPLFVKPNASGSSFGVTKVKSPEELLPAIEAAMRESDRVLMEQFIAGREVSCGMMITEAKEWILPVTELITDKEFFDFEAKYTPGVTNEVTPANLPPETVARLNRATATAYRTLNCRGVVRVDFIIDETGTPYFIEVNTTPGMSAESILPQQWHQAGLSMQQALTMIINDTLKR